MKGECFIEIVKIGAGLFHFMKILFEPQTDTRPQQEGAPHTTGRTRDVASVAASVQRRRQSKGLRSKKIFLDRGRKGW